MSDSGFSNLPPSAARDAGRYSQGRGQSNASLINIPESLENIRQPTRLEGQVVERTSNDTVRIQTDQGDITLRIPREASIPNEGDAVEIEIQPGRPPKQARVANAETQTQPQVQNTQSNQAPQTRAETPPQIQLDGSIQYAQAPQLEEQTALSINQIRQALTTRASSLELNTIVRLTVLSSNQIEQIIPANPNRETAVLSPNLNTAAQTFPLTGQALQNQTNFIASAQNTNSVLANIQSALGQSPISQIYSGLPTETNAPLSLINSAAKSLFANNLQQGAGLLSNTTQLNIAALGTQTNALANTLQPQSILSSNSVTSQNVTPGQNIENLIASAIAENNAAGTGAVKSTSSLINKLNTQSEDAFLDVRILNIQNNVVNLANPAESGASKPSIQSFAQALATPGLNQNLYNPAQNLSGQTTQLQAKVLGVTHDTKLPVLSFVDSLGQRSSPFSMQFLANNLPDGARIDLLVQNTPITPAIETSATAATSAAATAAAPLMQNIMSLNWPALDDLNQTLQQAASQTLTQNVTQHLPSPASPSRLPAAALLFVAAVRSGDLGGFLNDKSAEALKRIGKSGLVNRISGDINTLSRSSSEPISQDWRGLPLPMNWNGDLSQIMMYYKHDYHADDDTDKPQKSGTRFLFDLKLDKMGPVQLDGYHRNERLDLIVRMTKTPTSDMQKAMRRVYSNALEQVGTYGELSFQNKADKWIEIESDKENTFYHA